MKLPLVVLARPQLGENIGFVARLCANFGLPQLVLVQPAAGWEAGAARTGAMCPEVLAAARVAKDLASALAECTHVFGLTARAGRERRVHGLEELSRVQLPEDATPALVFGNETNGLSQEETALCTELLRANVPGLASMNLSHAVALALFAWQARAAPPVGHPARASIATTAEKAQLRAHCLEVLTAIGFRTDDPHLEGTLVRLIETRPVERRDVRMLHRILRHVSYRLGS